MQGDKLANSKLVYELQKRLVQCCIDFVNENKNKEIDEVSFRVDALQVSAKHGEWTPATDSYCGLFGWDNVEGRYDIAESM